MVVAATHIRVLHDGKHGSNAQAMWSWRARVKGIDLIVGGHSQNPGVYDRGKPRNDAYVQVANAVLTSETAP